MFYHDTSFDTLLLAHRIWLVDLPGQIEAAARLLPRDHEGILIIPLIRERDLLVCTLLQCDLPSSDSLRVLELDHQTAALDGRLIVQHDGLPDIGLELRTLLGQDVA